MTSAQVKAKITAGIGDQWDFKNAHGVDLRRRLVEPELRDYYDHNQTEPPEKLWLVLEEDSEQHRGYSIIYDEHEGMFGLAIRTQSQKGMCIGLYRSFIETFEAMRSPVCRTKRLQWMPRFRVRFILHIIGPAGLRGSFAAGILG